MATVRPSMPEAEEERHAEGQPRPERCGELGQRQAEQEAHQQPEQEPDDGRHELGGREVLDRVISQVAGTTVRYGRIGEPDDDPGDDPGGQQGPGIGRVAEQAPVRSCEPEPDQAAERGAQHTDIADHVFLGG